jgi:hypothetical protein
MDEVKMLGGVEIHLPWRLGRQTFVEVMVASFDGALHLGEALGISDERCDGDIPYGSRCLLQLVD